MAIWRQLTRDQPPTNSALRESTGFAYAARIEGATLATMVTDVKSTAATASVTGAQGFRSKSKFQAIMLFFRLAYRAGTCFSIAVST